MGSVLARAAEFIEISRRANSIAALDASLLAQCRPFGVDRAASARIGRVGGPLALGRVIGRADEDWVQRYRTEGFAARDPAARRAIANLTPFSWKEAEDDAGDDEDARIVFGAAREHDARAGFVVPVHGGDGSLAVVTFRGAVLALDPESRSYLHLLAIYFHIAAERLRLVDLASAHPSITPRQLECLKWIAAGKTDWEIGRILDLSEATVNRHVERAKERLGVRTRAQAVVQAMASGILDF
jgi:DNA-binding CsgD family transcriptional regulator